MLDSWVGWVISACIAVVIAAAAATAGVPFWQYLMFWVPLAALIAAFATRSSQAVHGTTEDEADYPGVDDV